MSSGMWLNTEGASEDFFGDPVQDTTELAAIPFDSLTDKQVRWVEDSKTFFGFDLQATSGAFQPDDAPGGNGYWIASIAVASPGGLNEEIQINNAGVLDGITIFTFDGTTFLIGSGTKLSKALFQFNSTTQGILPPRMTTAQRNAISPGASEEGLMIINTDNGRLNTFNGSNWRVLGAEDGVENGIQFFTTAAEGHTSDSDFTWNNGTKALTVNGTINNALIGEDNDNFFFSNNSNVGSGVNNLKLGFNAMPALTTGNDNVGVGKDAGMAITSGSNNVSLGKATNFSLTGTSNNVSVGSNAYHDGNGSQNTIVGGNAFQSAVASNLNTIVGNSVAAAQVAGSDNVYIGASIGATATGTCNRNILIGKGVDVPSASTDDFLNIGAVIFGDLASNLVGINTSTPTQRLCVNRAANTFGGLEVFNSDTGTSAQAGLIVRTDDGVDEFGQPGALGWHFTGRSDNFANAAQQEDLIIEYATGGSFQTVMFLEHDTGNIGIGANVADEKLDVVGSIKASDDIIAEDSMVAGSDTIDANHQLKLVGTTKSFLPNILTDTQRDALTSVDGQTIYNSTIGALQVENSNGWSFASNPDVTRVIYARSLDQLPAPISNVITIPAFSMLFIEESFDIGANKIDMPATSTLLGDGASGQELSGSHADGVVEFNFSGSDFSAITDITVSNSGSGPALSVIGGARVQILNCAILDPIEVGSFAELRISDGVNISTVNFTVTSATAKVFIQNTGFIQFSAINSINIETGISIGSLQIINPNFTTFTGGTAINLVDDATQVGKGNIFLGNFVGTGTDYGNFDEKSDNWAIVDVNAQPESSDKGVSSATNASGTTVTINTVNVWEPISGTGLTYALATGAQKFSLASTTTGELDYDGVRDRGYKTGGKVNVEGTSGTDNVEIGISINGADPDSRTISSGVITNTQRDSVTIPTASLDLIGDGTNTLTLMIRNTTDADDVIVYQSVLSTFY